MKKADITEDDRRAFEEAMRGVTPLQGRTTRVAPKPTAPTLRPPTAAKVATVAPKEQTVTFQVEAVGEIVKGWSSDLDRRILRDLARGEKVPEASLDLHGKTVPRGEHAITLFVAASVAAGRRCVAIVHGRGLHSEGRAVLKEATIRLLAEGTVATHVLAFCSAPPAMGGPGALLVLLRRTRVG
ncbi:MAG: Smr/MutS family protein [Deltaproteobacteria bacterium]|nr:Smr/MutS family protein [Deltaproteobacteria bacterium]